MTDLRKAAEMALNYFESAYELDSHEIEIVEALRQALAMEKFSEVNQEIEEALKQPKPKQETFTLDRGCWERGCMAYDTRDCNEGTTVYVDAVNMSQECVDETAKHEHEWVGLTRTERFEIQKSMSKYYDYQHECKTVCLPEFAAAIEAKLKEKNCGTS